MSDKIMLVTGGGRGIGAATARLAAARGYDVCVNYMSDAKAAQSVVAAVEAAGQRALAVQGDVGDPAAVERIFAAMDRDLGPVTALVNNAGMTGHFSRLDEVSDETLRRAIDINVLGSIICARAAVRRMSTKHGGKGGGIVNLSSRAVGLGSPGEYVWYAAAKGAIDSLTLGLAREVAKESIRVNAVAPGLIDTEIHETSGMPGRLERMAPMTPMARAGTAEEVAETILWLLSDAASYVTGAIVTVSGGR